MASWKPRTVDELRLAGEEHLDAGYVARYDRKAAFDPDDDVALLRSLGLGSEQTLLDIGAGTGTLALAAAPFCARVIAVDVSAPMLDTIRAKARTLAVSNLESVQAGFLSYVHEGPPVDVAYSRHALHHLPDLWKAIALERLASSMRPGGVLVLRDLVFSFDLADAIHGIEGWLDAASDDGGTGWTRAELEEHLQNEHSTFSWLLEPMLERAGFEVEHASFDSLGVRAGYVCRRRAS